MLTDVNRLRAVHSCRYCPMCHYADLTVTLGRQETYSARGRGLLLSALERDKAHWDSCVAEVMYSFFTDGLCRQVCAGHIPHDDLIIDARRRLVLAGAAPHAVAQVRTNIERTGNAWGEDEPQLDTMTGAKLQQEVLLYFGPAARIRRRTVVDAVATIFRKLRIDFSVLAAEGDPGLLLYQLGEIEAGEAATRALVEKIARAGARTVVTPDADAYRALKMGVGRSPGLAGISVAHISEYLVQHLADLKFHRGTPAATAYHDPCALARFAPCLEAPRDMIRAIQGTAALEIGVWTRELVHCSGECGGVPFTRPGLAQRAAAHRLNEARRASVQLVVAGSPSAAIALDHGGLKIQEFSEFVAQSLV